MALSLATPALTSSASNAASIPLQNYNMRPVSAPIVYQAVPMSAPSQATSINDIVTALGTALSNQGTKYVGNNGMTTYQAPSILTCTAKWASSATTGNIYYLMNTDVCNTFLGTNPSTEASSLTYSDGFGGKLISASLASYKNVWIKTLSLQFQNSSSNADPAGLLGSVPKTITYLPDGTVGNEFALALQTNPSLYQTASYIFDFSSPQSPGILLTRGTQIAIAGTAGDTATIQMTFAVEA